MEATEEMHNIHRSEDAWYVQDGTWTKIDNPIAPCGEVDASLFSSGYCDRPGLQFGNGIWEATVHYAANPKLLKPSQSRAPYPCVVVLTYDIQNAECCFIFCSDFAPLLQIMAMIGSVNASLVLNSVPAEFLLKESQERQEQQEQPWKKIMVAL
jgi:hypothetical protein